MLGITQEGFRLRTFDFRISSQSYLNENCHNSRNSDDFDMTLGPVTKLDKRNTVTPK